MTNFDTLPDTALLRERYLLQPAGPVPFSAPTLWRKVKNGTFPQPIRIEGGRMTCWRWGDVRRWLEAQGAKEAA